MERERGRSKNTNEGGEEDEGPSLVSVVGCAKRTRPEEMEPHLSMQSDPYVNWEKKGAH